jgi:gamma-glutamyltranspeptidase/glutathione hydrolase
VLHHIAGIAPAAPRAARPAAWRYHKGMNRIAIASSSTLSATAGARIADEGGNAVDAAIAASLVSMTTEPGVCSLGGGGFVCVRSPGLPAPVTIDGSITMPGLGLAPEQLGKGLREASFAYGGGLRTIVGHGSVGVPGALAALGKASAEHGRLPWHALVQPAFELARDGFPLLQPSYEYLRHAHEPVFGWNALSRRALLRDDGTLRARGERIVVDDLADSLARIARHGVDDFYRGETAARIAHDSRAHDGMLTAQDLASCEARCRAPLILPLDAWHIATNPPPAIGGTTLAAMLRALSPHGFDDWSPDNVARLVRVQRAVFGFRRGCLDLSDDMHGDARRLLEAAGEGVDGPARLLPSRPSSSTVHVSAVDDAATACAITMSAGYSAGVIPPGTGIWMNNCLGELELNRRGIIAGPPGTPIASNMAPTIAWREDGGVLAIGSPGADRITSAILHTLINFIHLGMSLRDAIDHPRLHTEVEADGNEGVACEPGIATDAIDIPLRRFDEPSMYFGGVGAALLTAGGELTAAADPRRTGGEAVGGQAPGAPA